MPDAALAKRLKDVIEPYIRSVCSDSNANSVALAGDIADAVRAHLDRPARAAEDEGKRGSPDRLRKVYCPNGGDQGEVFAAANRIEALERALWRSTEVIQFAYMNAPEQPKEIAEAQALLRPISPAEGAGR